MTEIVICQSEADFSNALQVTRDYIDWLNMDLSFQKIDDEIISFPSMYGPPKGVFLLAIKEGEIAGGVGLRALENKICEMKRLFVYDRFRKGGTGRLLCCELINRAGILECSKMRLDTLGSMTPALNLYKKLGFVQIEAYRYNPDPSAVYMERDLL